MAILDPVYVKPIARRLTAEDFFALYPDETLDKLELLEGHVAMDSPTPLHQLLFSRFMIRLGVLILDHQLGDLVTAPSDIYFDERNVLQPDLFFVAKEGSKCFIGADNRWHGAPELCIEILSPSTSKRDRQTKMSVYEQHGVREYWIVDPANELIEIFALTGDGIYRQQGVYAGEDVVQSTVIPQVNFMMKSVLG